MSVHNADIAAVFEEIAELLEVQDANAFRIRAYRNAARQLRAMTTPVAELVAAGQDLTELPAIGEDLAAKIQELVSTGHCRALDELRHRVPPTITELLKIPGLGPQRVRALHDRLKIRSLAELEKAARAGRIHELPGFGAKTESGILEALATPVAEARRFLLATAAEYAEPLREFLRQGPGATHVELAGSYRRRRETVGDLDILVTGAKPAQLMRHFLAYDEVRKVLAQGRTRATVVLACGLQVDLRVVGDESFGAALQYFTGSKAHNIELRRLAQARGLKLNEYGVFKGARRIAGATEESVYAALDLRWMPPTLRENLGEIAAARDGRLPALVQRADLRGDLHAHTSDTDGALSLRELALAARGRGLEYLAITDHSQHLKIAHGLDPARLRRQLREIEALNRELTGLTLLKGIEVDILPDGTLDLPDDMLAELDIVVGAVHSDFRLSPSRQTERILRAMDHPAFTILAHPSGRLLNQREPCAADMLQVMRKARARDCWLEINAQPERLDLNDAHCRMAHDEGVTVVISSDAHRASDFDHLDYGVAQAQRGWIAKAEVANTRGLRELSGALRAR